MTDASIKQQIAQLEANLKAEPGRLDFWLALAQLHQQRGDLAKALAAYERANQIAPDNVESLVNRGVALKNLGRNEEAVACYRRAIEVNPDLPEAHSNLGMSLQEAGENEQALDCFAKALALRPNYARAEINRSMALFALNRLEEAEAAARRAIEIDPTIGDAHLRLGLALIALNRQEEAVLSLRRQVECRPNDAVALSNLGVAVKEAGHMGEALAIQAEAQAINPKEASPFWNEAHVRLLCGDFAVGWERYGARWGTPDFKSSLRPFAEPQWKGEPLGNRALLISLEQGVGDSIMFGRFIRTVAERNPTAELIVEIQPSLHQIFRHSLADLHRLIVVPNINISGVNLPPFDLHVPMATLASFYAPRLEAIPKLDAYLKPDGAPLDYRQPGDRLVVGLSWHSIGATGRKRSLKLKQLAPLLAQPGVRLVDLQYGDTKAERAELAAQGIALTHDENVDAKRDLNAFARQVAGCDLVVSIDNTTVHMAGALGVPTWVLLHLIPDWRWLLRREDTPWYSSLKLLRQTKLGDWQPVLERLPKDLAALLAGDQTVLKAEAWQGPPAQEP